MGIMTALHQRFTAGEHPEDMLIERIAVALTHPVEVGTYFQLLKELDLPLSAGNDYVAMKEALLKRL